MNFFTMALQALTCPEPKQKCQQVARWYQALQAGSCEIKTEGPLRLDYSPGRPAEPRLVAPKALPKRKLSHPQGRVTLMHAIAHIEFNAINLALDACYRFRDLPQQYYLDWAKVAFEEAKHFQLAADYLCRHGSYYGEFAAHDGLWQMAEKTAHDVLARMALVPRVLEARGLDVTPQIQRKYAEINDNEALAVLAVIETEEVGHVAIGSRWFRYCCQQHAKPPVATFLSLLQQYGVTQIKLPLAREKRLQAEFTLEELAALEALATTHTIS